MSNNDNLNLKIELIRFLENEFPELKVNYYRGFLCLENGKLDIDFLFDRNGKLHVFDNKVKKGNFKIFEGSLKKFK